VKATDWFALFTVSVAVVLAERFPVAVKVMVYTPAGVLDAVITDKFLLHAPLPLDGDAENVTPAGRFVADHTTEPLPFPIAESA
jgi:hypothetical protein